MDLKTFIRDIPDFPKPGIVFKDVTPMLKDPEAFRDCIAQLKKLVEDLDFNIIVAPEARGFIFATPLSQVLNVGFIPVRKPGKLPYETISVDYSLEYGTATLQMHKDALNGDSKVLIVDDILATGGTLEAIGKMVEEVGAKVAGIATLAELTFLNPRSKLTDYDVRTIIKY